MVIAVVIAFGLAAVCVALVRMERGARELLFDHIQRKPEHHGALQGALAEIDEEWLLNHELMDAVWMYRYDRRLQPILRHLMT